MINKSISEHIKSPLGMSLLGAGIWQFIAYPILKYILNIGFDGSKSLAESLINFIYRTAATGDKQSASIVILEFIIYFICLGSFWLMVEIIQKKDKSKQKGKKLLEEVDDLIDRLGGKKEEKPSLEKQMEELLKLRSRILANLNFKTLDWLTRVMIVLLLVVTVFSIFKYTIVLKSNKIYTEFNQLMLASSPYLTETQIAILNSRFARINDKNDYKKIQSDIIKISNGEDVIMRSDPIKAPIAPSQSIK